jgi:DNA primase
LVQKLGPVIITGQDGDRDRRMNFNYTSEQTESILKSCDLRYRVHSDNFVMNCIFHDETKGSLNVHTSGYYKCFGCDTGKGKHMVDLVMRSLKLTGERAIKHLAAVTGIPEARLQFREFKSKAVAVYPYFDERGDRVKDKVRFFPKRFQWRTYIKRKKPLLYNAHLVQFATTVILVEGEKDADAITSLHLKDKWIWGSDIIGTTSGSATSWKDGHAVALRGKRVLILPDNDSPGQEYASQVLTSCISHGINWQLYGLPYGVSDVSDYLQAHSADELVSYIGSAWFAKPEQCIEA